MKNFIQKVKSLATFLAFAVFLCVPASFMHAMAAPELSSEDLKMLEEIGKEVERYVNALPTEAQLRAQGVPEEEIKKRETREKFDAEVKRYSEMSEKQLLEEMEKVFSEAANQMPQQPQREIEKPVYTPPVQQETKPIEKPIVPTDKQLATLKLIDDVLLSINNFMNKAQIMVELPGKIPTWIKEGKLRNWPAGLSWNTFRAQVEELQVKLNKIKDRDPRSGSFKYLEDFMKEESLINNLTKTRDSLFRNEPKIQIGSAVDKMTTESRSAIRSVLLSLHEATSILAIPAALDKIIEKYDPTAKKIKESEEVAQKRALEESRRGRYPGASITSTAPARERVETFGRGRDFDRFGAPSLEGPAKGTEKPSEALKPGDKGAAGTGGDKKAEAAKSADDKAKRETDKTATKYEDQFIAGIEAFSEAINESSNIKDLEKHIKNDSFIDEEVYKGINAAKEGINTAIKGIKKMKGYLGRLNDNQKKEYKKAMQEAYKMAKKDIDHMNTQITNLSKPGQIFLSMPVAVANREQHSLAIKSKFYAYGGKQYEKDLREHVETQKKKLAEDESLPSQVQKIEDLLKTPNLANINDLQAKMKELKKAVDEL